MNKTFLKAGNVWKQRPLQSAIQKSVFNTVSLCVCGSWVKNTRLVLFFYDSFNTQVRKYRCLFLGVNSPKNRAQVGKILLLTLRKMILWLIIRCRIAVVQQTTPKDKTSYHHGSTNCAAKSKIFKTCISTKTSLQNTKIYSFIDADKLRYPYRK